MSATGDLEVRFSKKILKPPLKITSADEDEQNKETRLLQASASGLLLHDIEEAVRIRVVDDGGDAEEADKSILSIKLDEVDE